MNCPYSKQPALYFDTLFSLEIPFNLQDPLYVESLINPDKRVPDIKYYRESANRFGASPDELAPFFTQYEGRSFAMNALFCHLTARHAFSMEIIEEYLPNADVMAQRLYAFFFDGATYEKNNGAVAAQAAGLETSDRVKYHLLLALLNPQPYYERLIHSVRERLGKVEALYAEQETLLQTVRKSADERLLMKLASYDGSIERIRSEAVVSVALLHKNAVMFGKETKPYWILGYDYHEQAQALLRTHDKPDMVAMGKALAEDKRVQILEILCTEPYLTVQQLTERFSLSVTAAHYHLNLLQSAGMLTTRNQGRTICYSLNREYFDYAPSVFEGFSTQKVTE